MYHQVDRIMFIVDHCFTDPCNFLGAGAATCSNGLGTFICTCNDGYTGDGITSCSDINECDSGPCHANATCANIDASFTCTCNGNLVGDGFTTCEGESIKYLIYPYSVACTYLYI